jgi:hypothetical protein
MSEKLYTPGGYSYYAMPSYNVLTANAVVNQIGVENRNYELTYEWLHKSHEEFVRFQKGLNDLGFLSSHFEMREDYGPDTDLDIPTTDFDYISPSLIKYIYDNGFNIDDYCYTPYPKPTRFIGFWQVLPLFSFNIQHGCITGISNHDEFDSNYSRTSLYVQAYQRTNLVNVRPIYVSNLNKQYSCDEALPYLEAIREIITEKFEDYGFAVTPEKINRVLMLDRLKIIGLVKGLADVEYENRINDYIYMLANSEATIESCLFALSRVCNPDYCETHEFALNVDQVVELNTIHPRFLYDMFG